MTNKSNINRVYYNENGVCIDAWLEKNRTRIFENKIEAHHYAEAHNSYVYEVFSYEKIMNQKKLVLVGYAVPK